MDGTLVAKKYDLMNGGGDGGSFAVKKKEYTGTGQTTITHDFGDETPKVIFCIVTKPADTLGNTSWHIMNTFAWGAEFTECRWQTGAGNKPAVTGNGGNHGVAVSYDGNKMTITGRDIGGACNLDGIDYIIYYV